MGLVYDADLRRRLYGKDNRPHVHWSRRPGCRHKYTFLHILDSWVSSSSQRNPRQTFLERAQTKDLNVIRIVWRQGGIRTSHQVAKSFRNSPFSFSFAVLVVHSSGL